MFANKDKFLHRNCKRNCSMSFNITPSPVTQSYRLYTTGEKNKCIKMFWGKCGTAQKACVTGGFCLPSAKMGGARSLAFTRVFAPDLLHICLSPTQQSPPKGKGEWGREERCWPDKNDCVWAETACSLNKSEATLVKGWLISVVSLKLPLVLRGMSWEGGKRRAPAVRVAQRRLGTSQGHRWNVELLMWRTQY